MSIAFAILLAVFAAGALLRVPLAISMLAAGMAYLLASGQDVGLAADQVMNSMYRSYIMLAIPMFILAANVMNAGTISERLWAAADVAVGGLRGGLGQVTVLVSTVFSSMSGSAITDAAGPGMVAIRMMRSVGNYRPGFAVAITAAAATIAPIIPPSIPMVLYALLTGTSVSAMFLGGVVPGLMMALALMAAIALLAKREGLLAAGRPAGAAAWAALRRGLLPLTLPVVLLGGIWSGVFTPTEAAAVAAFYAMVLAGVVYRALGWRGLIAVFAESMRQSAVVMILIAGAFVVNYAVTAEQLAQSLVGWIQARDLTALQFLLMANVMFLLLGCILDTGVLLLVVLPVLMPTVRLLEIDPVHFGVVAIVNFMIGLVTPPYGLLLFVLSSLARVPLADIMGQIWKFLIPLVGVLLLLVLFPPLVLWLPRLAGYTG
ncbi:TRAP transporter large permease [Ramlibacter sp. AW1]|uniref:TRAP transporter large permease protein n=1 Tax=Ramlibacter aurantiacus TaxID=2801330 RepID=A0A936ZNK7_9BURK|nr:TRAP transporter large permease [Ramlibacter aurantiacus]MBL0423047.1 TRAP transporter large permease [Ramlibacter aurantiacus]